MRNWCGLFLSVVDDLVYLLHQTAREFLIAKKTEDVAASTGWKSSIELWKAEILMTQKCLAYLLFPEFDVSELHFGVLSESKEDRARFGFYDYAARNWDHHFREIQGREEAANIFGSVFRLYFVESWCFRNWSRFCGFLCSGKPADVFPPQPLMLATELSHHVLIRQLVEAGHDIEVIDGHEKHTPFLRAVSRRDLVTSKALADLSANIEARDKDGQTALILLSKDTNGGEMLQWLIERGANLEAKDKYNKTALQYALKINSEQAITDLLEAGADKESKDEESRSILSFLAESNSSQAVRILLSSGADCYNEDYFGRTPLMWASQSQSDASEIINLLISHGADVNKRDTLGKTPLHWSVPHGCPSNTKILLEHNAAINARDSGGCTPLLYLFVPSATTNRLELVRLFVAWKAEINCRDQSGRTALCLLLRSNSRPGDQDETTGEIIRVLLTSGAEVETADDTGKTPLFWALEGGPTCLDLAEILLEFGSNQGSRVLKGHSIEYWAEKRSSPAAETEEVESVAESLAPRSVSKTEFGTTSFEIYGSSGRGS